jgi:nucleotide-binding universal stress UspA family protein
MSNILCVVDNIDTSGDILKRGVEFARVFNSKVIVVYTIHIPFFDLPIYSKKDFIVDRDKIKEKIKEAFVQVSDLDMLHYISVDFGDKLDRAILEAKRDGVSIVVVGDNMDYERLLSESKKSLLVVKSSYREYRNILFPTDLSEKSKESIFFIKEHLKGANFKLVYAYESVAVGMSMYDISYFGMVEIQEENRDIALRLFNEFKKEVGIDGDFIDVGISVPLSLMEYIDQESVDLVVVASHIGENGHLLMGSVSSFLAKELKCDIFIYN